MEKISQQINQLFLFIFFSILLVAPSSLYGQFFENRNPTIEKSGDIILFSLPAASIATTIILKDRKGTWQFTKGFVLNQGVTVLMKIALNKPRPFNGGDHAFPSGHTSTTFQSASFIHARYGFKYSIPGYILAGYTAFSRINAEKHDGYDILAGAAVGIGSTLLFTTPYQREHMKLTFYSFEDQFMLGFRFSF